MDINHQIDTDIAEVIAVPTLNNNTKCIVYVVYNNITRKFINNNYQYKSLASARNAAIELVELYNGCNNLV
jgi:hypothetical protein